MKTLQIHLFSARCCEGGGGGGGVGVVAPPSSGGRPTRPNHSPTAVQNGSMHKIYNNVMLHCSSLEGHVSGRLPWFLPNRRTDTSYALSSSHGYPSA